MNYRTIQQSSLLDSNTISLMTGSCAPQKGHEVCIHPSTNRNFQPLQTRNWAQPISLLFLTPQIADAIYCKSFNGKRKLKMLDLEFINCVNGTMVCLTCALLCHQLQAWQGRVPQEPPDIKPDLVGGRSPGISRVLGFCSYD